MSVATYFYYMGDFVAYEYPPNQTGIRAYATRDPWPIGRKRVTFSGGRKAVKKRIRQSLRARAYTSTPPPAKIRA